MMRRRFRALFIFSLDSLREVENYEKLRFPQFLSSSISTLYEIYLATNCIVCYTVLNTFFILLKSYPSFKHNCNRILAFCGFK